MRLRQRLAAQGLLVAGLVAGLLALRIGIPAVVAAVLLLVTAAAVWRWPGAASSGAGLVASVTWLVWALWWHLDHVVAVGSAPTIDAVSFLIGLTPAIFAALSSICCASSLARPQGIARHAA